MPGPRSTWGALAASSRARCATVSANLLRGTTASTRPHSTARLPFTPSASVENASEIAPHLALAPHARRPAGARQHAEQRHLRQRHRAGAVVGEQDLVAGQRQLVAAARGGAVAGG